MSGERRGVASSSGTGREYPPELVHGELCATRFGANAECDCGKSESAASSGTGHDAATVFHFDLGAESWNWPVSGDASIRAFRELLLRAQIGYTVSDAVASDGEQRGGYHGGAGAGTPAPLAPAEPPVAAPDHAETIRDALAYWSDTSIGSEEEREIHDAALAALDALLADRRQDKERIPPAQFLADVRAVVVDHWSGLPEHRPDVSVWARLDAVLFGDDEQPREVPDYTADPLAAALADKEEAK